MPRVPVEVRFCSRVPSMGEQKVDVSLDPCPVAEADDSLEVEPVELVIPLDCHVESQRAVVLQNP